MSWHCHIFYFLSISYIISENEENKNEEIRNWHPCLNWISLNLSKTAFKRGSYRTLFILEKSISCNNLVKTRLLEFGICYRAKIGKITIFVSARKLDIGNLITLKLRNCTMNKEALQKFRLSLCLSLSLFLSLSLSLLLSIYLYSIQDALSWSSFSIQFWVNDPLLSLPLPFLPPYYPSLSLLSFPPSLFSFLLSISYPSLMPLPHLFNINLTFLTLKP